MNYDIRQIYDWPLIPRVIVIGIVCIIVFYLGYFFDLSSLNVKYKAAQQQEEEYKTQIAALAHSYAEVNTELTKYSSLENAITELQKKLITHKDLPELLNEIIKIGKQNELEFINFTPGIGEQKGAYFKVDIKAVVIGAYDQIASFISQVANMDRTVAVSDIIISKVLPDKMAADPVVLNNRLVADLTFEVYEVKAR